MPLIVIVSYYKPTSIHRYRNLNIEPQKPWLDNKIQWQINKNADIFR